MLFAPETAGPSFACDACRTSFASRNALFRHLRSEATCARAAGMSPAEQCRAPKPRPPPRPTPNLFTHADALARRRKDEPRPHRELHLKTRPGSYEVELSAKVASMENLFQDCAEGELPSTEVFASPPEHFRMRAEFDIWQNEAGLSYVMFAGKTRVVVERYPMGSRAICDMLMPALLSMLQKETLLSHRLFQVSFHTTLHGDAMVSLLYSSPYARGARRARWGCPPPAQREAEEEKREETAAVGPVACTEERGPLTGAWEAAAARLRAALGGASVVGHVRGRKCVLGRDWVEERLEVAGAAAPICYRQPEGTFSQPNSAVAQHMLGWARAVARADAAAVGSGGPPRDDDLLELYCGSGYFAVALAPCFRRVLATELVKGAVEAAKLNAEANGAANVRFARVSAEELSQALDASRSFQRLAHVDLGAYDVRTVLVDPPRAGLGSQVAGFVARFPRIVYISCSPETLRRDLEVLRETHSIRRLAAFDQFPYTDHLEMGVLLVHRIV
mmetsp:Transcript_137940/g.384716  ORF Transcript_137940/g.384716 Transcript_137940/m.384716 type:complete len:505 (-) Transcript_137940:31-1545(-)